MSDISKVENESGRNLFVITIGLTDPPEHDRDGSQSRCERLPELEREWKTLSSTCRENRINLENANPHDWSFHNQVPGLEDRKGFMQKVISKRHGCTYYISAATPYKVYNSIDQQGFKVLNLL